MANNDVNKISEMTINPDSPCGPISTCNPESTSEITATGPMSDQEFNEFYENARRYFENCQNICEKEYGFGSYDKYELSEDRAEIVFSRQGQALLKARVEIIGSLGSNFKSWLWAWADNKIPESVRPEIGVVRDFGETHNIAALKYPTWPAGEAEGWAMTHVASVLLKAKGAYRIPTANGFIYLLFMSLEKL